MKQMKFDSLYNIRFRLMMKYIRNAQRLRENEGAFIIRFKTANNYLYVGMGMTRIDALNDLKSKFMLFKFASSNHPYYF